MKLKPLGDRVLVIQDKAEEETAGGIILPTNSAEKPNIGTVVAVGDKVIDCVKEQSRIMFGKYSGTEIKLSDEKHLIMKQEDIIGIVDK